MTIYQLKSFARFARGERIAAKSLIEAIERAERGLVDADGGATMTKAKKKLDDRFTREMTETAEACAQLALWMWRPTS